MITWTYPYYINHATCVLYESWISNIIFYSYIDDEVIKWKHFPHNCPSVSRIHRSLRSLVNSAHKGHWHGALMFFFICTLTNRWVNNWDTGDLRCHRTHYFRCHHAHYNINVMHILEKSKLCFPENWVAMIPTLSSLVTPAVAIMTTSGPTSVDKPSNAPL